MPKIIRCASSNTEHKRLKKILKSNINRHNYKVKHRILVSKSNKHLIAQFTDPDGKVLGGLSTTSLSADEQKFKKHEQSVLLGKKFAKLFEDKEWFKHSYWFDRRGFKYHSLRIYSFVSELRKQKVKI